MNKRTALITGANRGLGYETSRQLARRGVRVLLTSRRLEAAAAAARELKKEGLDVAAHELDVADATSIAALAAQIEGEVIDVLINNAGIYHGAVGIELARKTLAVNLFGAWHVIKALLARVPDGGNIVMVSSGLGELSAFAPRLRDALLSPELTRAGLDELMQSYFDDLERGRHRKNGWPNSAYNVSKAALNALVRILARELADRRIHINAVCPGWVRTDMGGPETDRSVETGAASIVWAAVQEDGPTGGFFRDGHAIPW